MAFVLDALRLIAPDGSIELRALTEHGMRVERFESHEAAEAWAASIESLKPKSVYVNLNPFDPTLIDGAAVTDKAVTGRRWLLVDVDPTRPRDTNSTRQELEAATETAKRIEEHLTSHGWPSPVRALSGNGAHLLYRIDLPNDPAAKALVDGVLGHLAAVFSSPTAAVDTTVSNAARITKLYGTRTRKGPQSNERPQRVSKTTRVPDPLATVTREQLAHVAALAPAPPSPIRTQTFTPGESAYDLTDVLSRVAVRSTEERDGATWYLIRCPWDHEHSSSGGPKETAIVAQSDGALGFKCLHAHCINRRWAEFRNYLAIDTKRWKDGERRRVAPPVSPAERAPEREPGDDTDEPAVIPSAAADKRVTVGDRARRPAVLARMDDYARTGAMPGAIPSGMKRLDGMLLGGFRPGMFYVIGGETGRGKTTLFLQWAIHAAQRVNLVGLITPEMNSDSLDDRALSAQTGFGVTDYKSDPTRVRDIWGAAAIPQNIRASFDPGDMRAFVEEERPGLLIVDYAQQAVSYETERRHTALALLGADCLAIAKHYNIPVLLGTQVNVTAERDFSVRETRILEHQADAIVYIDVQYEKAEDGSGQRSIKSAALRVSKNRHGSEGRVPVRWHSSVFRFEEV